MIIDHGSNFFCQFFWDIDKMGFLFNIKGKEEPLVAFTSGTFTIRFAAEPAKGFQGALNEVACGI
jgi:hypothetical protein